MTTYTVTKARKDLAANGNHRHIEGVITDGGTHYTRQQVVDSIDAGTTWKTSAGSTSATIEKMNYCLNGSCIASPYIKTNPESAGMDNLENLPEG